MSALYTQLFRLSGEHPALFWLGLLGLTALVAWVVGTLGSRGLNSLLRRLTSNRTDEFYDRVLYPQRQLLG